MSSSISGVSWYRSIRLWMVIGVILVEVVMSGLLLANNTRLLAGAIESQTQARLSVLSPLLDTSLSGPVHRHDLAEIDAILGQLSRSEGGDIRYLAVFDASGRPLASTGATDLRRLPAIDAGVASALADRVFDAEIPLTLAGTPVGSVRFGMSLAGLMAAHDSIERQGLLIAGAGIALSLLLLILGGYFLLRHVPRLLAATQRIAAGDYDSRVAVPGGDEVGVLAANFDAMATVIEDRIRTLEDCETERRRCEGELEYLAHHDVLTRLPNRRLLADRLAQAVARCRRDDTLVAIGYLDLDDFKAIDDEIGLDAGDRLLLQVAERLQGCIREGDTLSRFGSDEFVILLAGLKSQQECMVAFERLSVAVSQPYSVTEHHMAISACLGISVFPLDDCDSDTLIRHAELAVRAAKQAGRNRISLFDPERDQVPQAMREARARIERGLAHDEFVLHFQPKVDLRDGSVLGAEALIRWQHPERGLLPPAHFLPLIEDTDFAVVLGRWVLEAAIAEAEVWRRAGLDLTVNINVAARHLRSGSFGDDLQAVLARHPSVPAAAVELEVLETTVLDGMADVVPAMEACREFGVHFALDNFGTGHASLSFLRRLRVDTLKIDQSFVRGMLDDDENQAVVEGIVGLARAFRRRVVAKGVETAAHCVALINLGCHFGQGYGIARPMPTTELADWVGSRPHADNPTGGL